jgi:hypothetical protein
VKCVLGHASDAARTFGSQSDRQGLVILGLLPRAVGATIWSGSSIARDPRANDRLIGVTSGRRRQDQMALVLGLFKLVLFKIIGWGSR